MFAVFAVFVFALSESSTRTARHKHFIAFFTRLFVISYKEVNGFGTLLAELFFMPETTKQQNKV